MWEREKTDNIRVLLHMSHLLISNGLELAYDDMLRFGADFCNAFSAKVPLRLNLKRYKKRRLVREKQCRSYHNTSQKDG